MRACLIPVSGDPFIISLVLKLWKERWYDEIDKMYLDYNNHAGVPLEVVRELLGNFTNDPKIEFIYHPLGIDNCTSLVELLHLAKEDLVLLAEDDFFIFTPGIVDGYFKKIESYEADILGSPRYAYGEVADAAKALFDLDYSGVGDKGFAWWPAGFYCRRKDLLRTDLNFGSKLYKQGEFYKELNHTFEKDAHTDTFAWTSIQLRYQGRDGIDIPQYHAMPFLKDQPTDIPYIHAGSLSSGWRGYLSGKIPELVDDSAKQEMETRVAFWKLAFDKTPGFTGFREEYAKGIMDLILKAELDLPRIEAKYVLYRDLMRL
jgi:hypothetical protein